MGEDEGEEVEGEVVEVGAVELFFEGFGLGRFGVGQGFDERHFNSVK